MLFNIVCLQLTDESDREHELISPVKITDNFIKAQPKSSTNVQAIQSSPLEIQTGLSLWNFSFCKCKI